VKESAGRLPGRLFDVLKDAGGYDAASVHAQDTDDLVCHRSSTPFGQDLDLGDRLICEVANNTGECRLGNMRLGETAWLPCREWNLNSPDACSDSFARTIRATTYAPIFVGFTSGASDRPLLWAAQSRGCLLTVRDDRWPRSGAGTCYCTSAETHPHRAAVALTHSLRHADAGSARSPAITSKRSRSCVWAARWAPRATKVSSAPAPASEAPYGPPMPPVPITAMRIDHLTQAGIARPSVSLAAQRLSSLCPTVSNTREHVWRSFLRLTQSDGCGGRRWVAFLATNLSVQ
jgi:hypothetical protein